MSKWTILLFLICAIRESNRRGKTKSNRGGVILSFYQLEKETGRDHHSLKKWHDLYKQYENDFAELHLRTQKDLGNWLKEQGKGQGEYPRKQTSEPPRFAPTLSDMKITYDQSSNWQLIASIPEGELENYEEK